MIETVFMSALYIVLGLVPFSILRYYPFLHKLRLRPVWFWSLYSGIVLVETVWFVGIEQRGTVLGVSDGELLRLVFYGVHLLLSCLVIRERPETHLFVWCLNFICSSTLTALSHFTETLIGSRTPHLTCNLTMLICLVPFMLFGLRFMKDTVIPLLEHTGRHTHVLITSMLFAILAMGLVTTRELPFQGVTPLALLCLRLAAFLGVVFSCMIFKSMMDEQQKILLLEQEHQHQEALLAISKKQFAALSDKIQEAKRARHDLKHHFAAVQNYLAQKDYDGLSSYISEQEKILPATSVLNFCENSTINMILSYYHDKADACGIPMEISAVVPPIIPFLYTETWVLLGNLLENALEGSLRIVDGQKLIRVKIECRKHVMGIAIDNLCNESALIQTDAGFSSVKNNDNCGNGLSSVTLLAKKHNGMANFEVKNGWFLASVTAEI